MSAGTRAAHPRRTALSLLALCFLCYAVVRGLLEAYAVFLLPLVKAFDWSRAEVSGVYSLAFVIFGVCAPVIGALSDRWGPLRVALLGVVTAAAAAALASRADALWQFYATLGAMMGFAAACVGFVPIAALLSRWFRERLNSALAIAHSASGAGILILAPAAQMLIDWGGWRAAYLVLGTALAALLPVFLAVRWDLALAGHPAYRAPPAPPSTKPRPVGEGGGGTLRQAFRSAAFWGMAFSYLSTAVGMFLVALQTPAYLVEIGYTPQSAATAFGALGLLVPVGMLGFGWLGDRIGRARSVLISYGVTMVGIASLMALASDRSPALLALFLLGYGGTFGCRSPALSTIAATVFRGPQFGRIYGSITMGMGIGGGIGAWLGGFLHDVTGSYQTGLGLAIVFIALGATPFVVIRALARN
jgi:MFS family permease